MTNFEKVLTMPMPTAVHEAPDMESAFEILDQCADIISDYREAGCPGFPESNPFYDRLRAVGVEPYEALDILATTWDNTEENV